MLEMKLPGFKDALKATPGLDAALTEKVNADDPTMTLLDIGKAAAYQTVLFGATSFGTQERKKAVKDQLERDVLRLETGEVPTYGLHPSVPAANILLVVFKRPLNRIGKDALAEPMREKLEAKVVQANLSIKKHNAQPQAPQRVAEVADVLTSTRLLLGEKVFAERLAFVNEALFGKPPEGPMYHLTQYARKHVAAEKRDARRDMRDIDTMHVALTLTNLKIIRASGVVLVPHKAVKLPD